MALTAPLSVEGKEGFNMALTAPLSVEGKECRGKGRIQHGLDAPLSVEGKEGFNMALTAPLSVEGKEGFNMALTAPLSVEGKEVFNMDLTAPLNVEGKEGFNMALIQHGFDSSTQCRVKSEIQHGFDSSTQCGGKGGSVYFVFQHTGQYKKAVLAINQCCTVVAPNDTFLVAKCCQLISNLILKQSVKVEGQTLHLAVKWSCQALRNCADIAVLDILLALETLLRGNGGKLEEVDSLLGDRGTLTSLLETGDEEVRPNQLAPPEEVRLFCVRCLEALTFPSDEEKTSLEEPYLETCAQIFLKTLCQQKHLNNDDELSRCKLVISCLRGLENVLVESGALLDVLLGDVLGVVRAFMLYGLPSHSGLVPQPVFPVHLAQTDISQRKNESRGKKVVRLRKNKNPAQKKKNEAIKSKLVDEDPTNSSTSPQFNKFRCFATPNYSKSEVHQGYGPSWLRMSDSDYSDTEAGQATRIRDTEARVRQAAHSLLLSTIKACDKKVLFGYWPSLLPDGPHPPHTRTLITCLLKDPSPKGRMAVSSVLINMLLGSRLYLSQAEDSERNMTAFTPWSVTVGNMVRELHRSLCLAVIAENSLSVLTQLLRCLAALVQNTPYHRLAPGLVTRVVSIVCRFITHKDAKVQVSSLTVLGSVVAFEPSTPEILRVILKPIEPRLCTEDGDHMGLSTSEACGSSSSICEDAVLTGPCLRLTLSFQIRSKTDAQPEALIGQESAPKPPPPLKDHTCKNRCISQLPGSAIDTLHDA
uniref:HEAT repeat-containing protein 6 n=1 Tax=Timema poppense TaxID=170557 RepID=A0A7R9D3W9_TIMPO|nr:unnamed protein product [Timema poppensis]